MTERGGRLRVDPVACEGVGICAHVSSGLVSLDSWGFPIVPDRPLSRAEERAAARSVRACPRSALLIEPPAEPGAW